MLGYEMLMYVVTHQIFAHPKQGTLILRHCSEDSKSTLQLYNVKICTPKVHYHLPPDVCFEMSTEQVK